jgi:hypothetical protein
MRPTRNCFQADFNSGKSGCPIDYGKIKGAIIVPAGEKLPAGFDGDALREACHADVPNRIYPVITFVEYAKNGGEPQVSAVGYGPNKVTGINAQTDTFTLDEVDYGLNAELLKSKNVKRDVYYFDENGVVYGVNDGTDVLAGIPMACIYPTIVPHPTSSAKESLTVSFCHVDAEKSQQNYDFITTDFHLEDSLIGLVPVELVKDGDNKYHIVEKIGGYDRTAEFGPTVATKASSVIDGISAATYEDGALTLTVTQDATPALKAPSALYANGIEGIVGV